MNKRVSWRETSPEDIAQFKVFMARLTVAVRQANLSAQDKAVLRAAVEPLLRALAPAPLLAPSAEETDGGRWLSSDPCPVCGGQVWGQSGKAGGRPRVYCSEECRQLLSLLGRVESHVEHLTRRVAGDVGRRALAQVKAQLWRAGNLTNAAGRLARSGEWRDGKNRAGWRGLRPETPKNEETTP